MRKIFGFVLGAFAGWLTGSTIALLLAPESGEKLRDELRSRSNGFVSEVKSAAETRRQQLEDQLAVMRAPRTPGSSD